MKCLVLNMAKFSKPTMDLKSFMVRMQVLKLYKELLSTAKQVEDLKYQKEIVDWIRNDFRAYKNITDPTSINIYITYGQKCLKELQTSINLAK